MSSLFILYHFRGISASTNPKSLRSVVTFARAHRRFRVSAPRLGCQLDANVAKCARLGCGPGVLDEIASPDALDDLLEDFTHSSRAFDGQTAGLPGDFANVRRRKIGIGVAARPEHRRLRV